MKIYAVGDSFTAGAELADHEYNLQDYPGFCKYSERIAPGSIYSAWGNQRYHYVKKHRDLPDRERLLAYPQQLGNILNIPVINQGIGGCSMQTIQRNLYKFLQTNKDPVYIFFQPTHWTRWTQFYENTWRDFLTTMDPKIFPSDLADSFKFRILNETTYSWIEQWFTIFYSCVELIRKNPLVQRYWIIDAGFLEELVGICRTEGNTLSNDLLDRIMEYLDVINYQWQVLDLDKNLNENRSPYLCPGGHYNYHVHVKLAHHLANKIQHGIS